MVTLTDEQLSFAVRLTADPAAPVPAADLALMLIPRTWAAEEVVRAAPDAPDSAHNLAVTVLVGYALDQPPAAAGGRFANAWPNSGAVFILRPWLTKRGIAITGADGMTWPWSRRTEQRAGSVTDSVIAELQRRAAGGSSGDPSLCAAVQTAAGIWARSFAAAAVSPASGSAAAVTPAILHMIGRDLVLQGQSVMQFGVAGGPMLRRPAEYDLTGSPDPATWAYRLRYIGPTRDSTSAGTVADVCHIRLNEDARSPHCGTSPILAAADTAGALAGLERALRLEANATSGYLIPSASSEGMDDASFTALKSDLAKLNGGTRNRAVDGAAPRRPARAKLRRRLAGG